MATDVQLFSESCRLCSFTFSLCLCLTTPRRPVSGADARLEETLDQSEIVTMANSLPPKCQHLAIAIVVMYLCWH